MTCSLDFIWCWQKLPLTGKGNWQGSDNMVPVHATATEPSVLTLLLKQTQLFMRAKLNQTVGVAEKTSVCEVFLSTKSLRKGGGSTESHQHKYYLWKITNGIVKWEQTPRTPADQAAQEPKRRLPTDGYLFWIVPSSLFTTEKFFLINYFGYIIFLGWSTSPFTFLNREEWTTFNRFLDLYAIWCCIISTPVWSPNHSSSTTWEHAGTANTQNPPQTHWLRRSWGEAKRSVF